MDREQTLVVKALVGLVAGQMGFAILRPVVCFYSGDPAVMGLVVPLLRVFCIAFLFIACAFGLGAVFSDSGYNLPFLVSSLAAKFSLRDLSILPRLTVEERARLRCRSVRSHP